MTELKYRRVLLKLSGEALMGDRGFGIDPKVVDRLAGEIVEAHRLGIQVGVVVGGGNIFRGVSVAADGGDRTTGDYLGMLGTVMNALAMRTAIERLGAKKDGVIRGQALRRDGTVRDTVMYSVTAGEWPEIRAHLDHLLDR